MFYHQTKLWMFPEGTRNSSRASLLPFKKGAFRVAITCQVPILPVVYSPYYFINDKKKFFGPGMINMKEIYQCCMAYVVDKTLKRPRNT
jgi:lysophosphatidate acyltransferase